MDRTGTVGAAAVVALLAMTWAGPAAAGARPNELHPAGSAVSPGPPSPPSVSPLDAVDRPAVGPERAGPRSRQAGSAMNGQFVVVDGTCGSGATPVGSYFSMLDPSGNPVDNGDSPCSAKAATPVRAGDSGLTPGRMQPFAGSPGASRAIIAPTTFFGSPFAVATEGPDKQSGAAVEAPSITESGGKLTGEISSFQAFYNGAYYNQGAPKPGGGTPGRTTDGLSGTYDPGSGAFVLEWRSTITGGAFSNFTGVWHLEGTYQEGSGGGASSGAGTSGEPTGSTSSSSGTSTAAGGAGSPGGAGRLANTGPSTGTGFAVLAALAIGFALWSRRAGWSR